MGVFMGLVLNGVSEDGNGVLYMGMRSGNQAVNCCLLWRGRFVLWGLNAELMCIMYGVAYIIIG